MYNIKYPINSNILAEEQVEKYDTYSEAFQRARTVSHSYNVPVELWDADEGELCCVIY